MTDDIDIPTDLQDSPSHALSMANMGTHEWDVKMKKYVRKCIKEAYLRGQVDGRVDTLKDIGYDINEDDI